MKVNTFIENFDVDALKDLFGIIVHIHGEIYIYTSFGELKKGRKKIYAPLKDFLNPLGYK